MGGVASCVGNRTHGASSLGGRGCIGGGSRKAPIRRSRCKKPISATFNMIDADVSVEQLHINTATEEELMTLPGIDRETASKIVEHRKQIRGFKRVEDLALVSGVGAMKLTRIRMEICVNRKKQSENSSVASMDMDNVSRTSMRSQQNRGIAASITRVNVNKANVFQLMKAKGISQQLAQNIVAYRDKKGLYRTLNELGKVKGVSRSVLSAIKPYLVLQDDELTRTNSVHNQLNGYSNASQLYSHNRSLSYITDYCHSADIGSGINLHHSSHHQSHKNKHHHLPHTAHSVDDILHSCGPHGRQSYRPHRETVLLHKNSKPIVRVATWNLEDCSIEKAANLGVKEVVAMTLLENGISLLAVQDLKEAQSLQRICDELNSPEILCIKQFDGHSGYWKCLISDAITTNQGKEYLGFLYDTSRGVEVLESRVLDLSVTQVNHIASTMTDHTDTGLVSAHDQHETSADNHQHTAQQANTHVCDGKAAAMFATFRMDSWKFCIVNVHIESCSICQQSSHSSGCDSGIVSVDTCQRRCDIVTSYLDAHSDGQSCIVLGCLDTNSDVSCAFNSSQQFGNTHKLLSKEHRQICHDMIWLMQSTKSLYTGSHGIVREGLSSQWIPKGYWSWGGTVSEHEPIWTEMFIEGSKNADDLQEMLRSVGLSLSLSNASEHSRSEVAHSMPTASSIMVN